MRMRNRGPYMTAQEKRDADWTYAGQFMHNNRLWIEQRDRRTGKKRFVTDNGKRNTIRYGSIN